MKMNYEVEWTYTNKLGYYYTEHRSFETSEEQHAFAKEKYNETNVCEVYLTTIEVWRKK